MSQSWSRDGPAMKTINDGLRSLLDDKTSTSIRNLLSIQASVVAGPRSQMSPSQKGNRVDSTAIETALNHVKRKKKSTRIFSILGNGKMPSPRFDRHASGLGT
jgi:hypothetical protein